MKSSKWKKLTVLFLFLSILVIAVFYAGDPEYLTEKSADKMWYEFSASFNQIVKKGDLVIYEPSSNSSWVMYSERFNEYISSANSKNKPHIKKTYIFETSFSEHKDNLKINFKLSDPNTGDILEEKTVESSHIKYTSLLPAILALLLCFFIPNIPLVLFISVLTGSLIQSGLAPIIGIKNLFFKYIPSSFLMNNLDIILFFIITLISIRILSASGGFKGLKKSKNIFKYLLYPFLYFHPYSGVMLGSWQIRTLRNRSLNVLTGSFVSHVIALILASMFIAFPYVVQIPYNEFCSWELFYQSLMFRFFSVTIILSLFIFRYVSRRNDHENIYMEETQFPTILKDKKNVKGNSFTPIIYMSTFLLFFVIFSTFNDGMNRTNDSMLYASLASLFILIIMVIKNRFLNLNDIAKYSFGQVYSSSYYVLTFILMFALSELLIDMGTSYYLVSLFKIKIGTPFFPLICFLITTLISTIFGNSLLSIAVITPILLPISTQLGTEAGTAIILASIIEGGIAGELLSPYSPTTTMICGLYGLEPLKYKAFIYPRVITALLISISAGFILSGTDSPIWVNYLILALFTIFFVSVGQKHTERSKG